MNAFVTDDGLRRAIESLFAQVDPILGEQFQDAGFEPYFTYAIGTKTKNPDMVELRLKMFKHIHRAARSKFPQIMKWRTVPVTDSGEVEVKITTRLVWKDIIG